LTTRIISKLFVAGVLLCASSQAAEPEGTAVARQAIPATVAQIEALENHSLVSLNRVHFSAGHSNPTRNEQAMLDQSAKTLSKSTNSVIELRGYADGAASPAENIALSVERANAIARFLIERHVAQERILILGLGEVDPTGPTGRADNQRVDIRVFAPPTAETSVRRESIGGRSLSTPGAEE
jgi:outer membrane protein OmpA-like peptidoglycan-associated protein